MKEDMLPEIAGFSVNPSLGSALRDHRPRRGVSSRHSDNAPKKRPVGDKLRHNVPHNKTCYDRA